MVVDESTDFGRRAAAHLREDTIVWLTTVGANGAPLPTPVWFVWDGADSVRVQSLPTASRVRHIGANPRVALNFAGDGRGGDIVVLSGRATVDADAPPVHRVDAYVEKYRSALERMGLTAEQFGQRYAVALRVDLTRVRGH
jgi:PPOX class probable F420-dependent enzyme